jgi:hypothetical protein
MRRLSVVGVLVAVLGSAGAAGAEEFPKGTFTQKGPDETVFSIMFDGKGKFAVRAGDMEVVEGTYKVTKDEIEFTDVKGPAAGKGDDKIGSYKWKFADKKLTFTKVKDEAKGRSNALTSGTWALKE